MEVGGKLVIAAGGTSADVALGLKYSAELAAGDFDEGAAASRSREVPEVAGAVFEATDVAEGSIGSNFDDGRAGAEFARAVGSASLLLPHILVGFHQPSRGPDDDLQPGIRVTAAIVIANTICFSSIARLPSLLRSCRGTCLSPLGLKVCSRRADLARIFRQDAHFSKIGTFSLSILVE